MKNLLLVILICWSFSSQAVDLSMCFSRDVNFDSSAPSAKLKLLNDDGSVTKLAETNIVEAYDEHGTLIPDFADYQFPILENCKDTIAIYREKLFVEIQCDTSQLAYKSLPCNNMDANTIPIENHNINTQNDEICKSDDCISDSSNMNQRIFKMMNRTVKALGVSDAEFSFDQSSLELLSSSNQDDYELGLKYITTSMENIEKEQILSNEQGYTKTKAYPLTPILKGWQASMDAYSLEGIIAQTKATNLLYKMNAGNQYSIISDVRRAVLTEFTSCIASGMFGTGSSSQSLLYKNDTLTTSRSESYTNCPLSYLCEEQITKFGINKILNILLSQNPNKIFDLFEVYYLGGIITCKSSSEENSYKNQLKELDLERAQLHDSIKKINSEASIVKELYTIKAVKVKEIAEQFDTSYSSYVEIKKLMDQAKETVDKIISGIEYFKLETIKHLEVLSDFKEQMGSLNITINLQIKELDELKSEIDYYFKLAKENDSKIAQNNEDMSINLTNIAKTQTQINELNEILNSTKEPCIDTCYTETTQKINTLESHLETYKKLQESFEANASKYEQISSKLKQIITELKESYEVKSQALEMNHKSLDQLNWELTVYVKESSYFMLQEAFDIHYLKVDQAQNNTQYNISNVEKGLNEINAKYMDKYKTELDFRTKEYNDYSEKFNIVAAEYEKILGVYKPVKDELSQIEIKLSYYSARIYELKHKISLIDISLKQLYEMENLTINELCSPIPSLGTIVIDEHNCASAPK